MLRQESGRVLFLHEQLVQGENNVDVMSQSTQQDLFLRQHMEPEGWTSLELISQFPMVRFGSF